MTSNSLIKDGEAPERGFSVPIFSRLLFDSYVLAFERQESVCDFVHWLPCPALISFTCSWLVFTCVTLSCPHWCVCVPSSQGQLIRAAYVSVLPFCFSFSDSVTWTWTCLPACHSPVCLLPVYLPASTMFFNKPLKSFCCWLNLHLRSILYFLNLKI